MCGIVGFTGRENALPILIKGLYSLEYRGYDSAGVAAFTKDGLRVVKARGRIANLEEKIKEEGGDMYCTCGIGHTRWATHGEPSDRNSHPHLGGKGKVAVVHNGIIENYKELRERLEAHGYEFKSETDTETVAHLVDYLHTGKQEDLAKTVLQAVQRLRGSYALGVVSMDNTQEIVAARRGNPLVIGIGEGENMIASDITAIINRTKRYIILDDNEVAIVRPDSVVVMNEFGDTVEKEIMTVTWDMSAAEKGGYQHFMLKEIMEQPKAVADTVKPRIKNDAVVFEDNGLTDERLREIEHIHIIGCGSALHAGMVGKRVIEAMCRIRCTAEVASEFRYENPIIGKKDMCIVISQSGETLDTMAALREANGGQLPETAFLCPEVREPADLAKYNGFYDYESLGMFNLFLTPVYDTESARQFRASMNKEFGIDQEYSGRADRLLAHLETFVNSFSDPGLDYTEAEEAIRTFLVQGGFPLFDPEEEGASDIFVIPEGGFAPNEDPTV